MASVDDIITINVHFDEDTSTYLIKSKNPETNEIEAAFVDATVNKGVGYMLTALEEQKVDPAAIKYILVTHIHLDHCGGAARLLKACPNASVICHSNGLEHLLHPEILYMSAQMVYGDKQCDHLFGKLEPLPKSRVKPIADNEKIIVGEHTLVALHTLGHAPHHVAFWDESIKGLFAGDNMGLSYPSIVADDGTRFVCPDGAPPDFDINACLDTLKRFNALNPEHLYLGHYGEMNMESTSTQMKDALLHFGKTVEEALGFPALKGPALTQHFVKVVKDWQTTVWQKYGFSLNKFPEYRKLLSVDDNIVAQGLAGIVNQRRVEVRRRARRM